MRLVMGGPSRMNDRAFTVHALDRAIVSCRQPDLMVTVARLGFALDAVLGLHPDAREDWPRWAEAERSWWSLWQAVQNPPDPSTARGLRAQAVQRTEGLRSQVIDVASEEDVLAEVALILDGTLPGGS